MDIFSSPMQYTKELSCATRSGCYETFFMLNSGETEIYPVVYPLQENTELAKRSIINPAN